MEIKSAKIAYAAGKLAAAMGMPTYDLTGEMDKRKIPVEFRGSWLSGVEDALDHDPDVEAEQRAHRVGL